MRFVVIDEPDYVFPRRDHSPYFATEEIIMKTWTKPEVREQEVGLEVTSYLPAEIDLI